MWRKGAIHSGVHATESAISLSHRPDWALVSGSPLARFAKGLGALLLLLATVTMHAREGRAEERLGDRDLEPLPKHIVFTDPEVYDPPTYAEIVDQIDGSFADLNKVVLARERLIFRYGLVSMPALRNTLYSGAASRTHSWNALLTIGAFRDTCGPTPESRIALSEMLKLLSDTGSDPHRIAFAALAFGCFPWTDGSSRVTRISGDGDGPVPGPARQRWAAKERLDRARTKLLQLTSDPFEFVSVAAMLALAKTGGQEIEKAFNAKPPAEDETTARTQSRLVASAILRCKSPEPFLSNIHREHQQSVVATACLALGLCSVHDSPPPWTRDAKQIKKIMSVLTRGINIRKPQEGAESVFARGAFALANNLAGTEWRHLYELALAPTSETEVARAAAQSLLFCRAPWLDNELIARAADVPIVVKEPTLALALLRAGQSGTKAGTNACVDWLRTESRRPTPSKHWDPRWYAAIGLLRALHAERIANIETRIKIVEALEYATKRVFDREAKLTTAMATLIAAQKRRLTSAQVYPLEYRHLRNVEASVRCPHALLSSDIVDVAVRRANDMVFKLFRLDSIIPSKEGQRQIKQQPERYLKRYFAAFPYFSRLHFARERGRRTPPTWDATSAWVIDR